MLTDVFSIRYEELPLFRCFGRREARFFLQSLNLLSELHPTTSDDKEHDKDSKRFWETVQGKVANELGLTALSSRLYNNNGVTRLLSDFEIVRNFMIQLPTEKSNVDEFIKDRLSLVEVAMREYHESILRKRSSQFSSILLQNITISTGRYSRAEEELSIRLNSARMPLEYHNGFLQIKGDAVVSEQIEQPFWRLVSDEAWHNVDLDMKEALDQRDSGGKDPALYAAKALESTIKIISDEIKVTHGREKGANNYIENLTSKKVKFIEPWLGEAMKHYFTKVRNPLGHGPGKEPMPILSETETNWAIETAMTFVKMLVTNFADRELSK